MKTITAITLLLAGGLAWGEVKNCPEGTDHIVGLVVRTANCSKVFTMVHTKTDGGHKQHQTRCNRKFSAAETTEFKKVWDELGVGEVAVSSRRVPCKTRNAIIEDELNTVPSSPTTPSYNATKIHCVGNDNISLGVQHNCFNARTGVIAKQSNPYTKSAGSGPAAEVSK